MGVRYAKVLTGPGEGRGSARGALRSRGRTPGGYAHQPSWDVDFQPACPPGTHLGGGHGVAGDPRPFGDAEWSPTEYPMHADGEILVDFTSDVSGLRLRVLPGALQMMV